DKCFWRDRNSPDLLHLLLTFLLFVEQLALSRDITAITFRSDVLAHFTDVVARDNLPSDGGLNRDFEHLRRNDFGELFAEFAPLTLRFFAVHNARECVHRITVDHD